MIYTWKFTAPIWATFNTVWQKPQLRLHWPPVVAAYGTAGAALPAAERTFIDVFIPCVGSSFSVPYPFPDESHWEFNC
jgi:hypothetical protein